MQLVQSCHKMLFVFGLLFLTSCEQIVNLLDQALSPEQEAAEAFPSENYRWPFNTVRKETAHNDGLTAEVILWINVKSPEAKDPESYESVVTVHRSGDHWKGKEIKSVRSIVQPPSASLSQIEVVEITDPSGKLNHDLCQGNNSRADTPLTFKGKLQLCFRYTTPETETLSVTLLKEGEKNEKAERWLVLMPSSGRWAWAVRPELSAGRYEIQFQQYSTIVATYKFHYEQVKGETENEKCVLPLLETNNCIQAASGVR